MLRCAILMSVGLLGATVPAVADPGQTTYVEEEISGPHFLSAPCGMQITAEGTITRRATTYPNGLERIHLQVDLVLTGNGKAAREQARFNVTVDPEAGTVTLRGTVVNIHARGSGQLLKDVGRIVRDLGTAEIDALAGRWDVLDDDFDAVCSYFSAA